MACHCNEFSRAHLLREAAAQAGNGLPAIEPGMPVPAGTGLNRRSFLLRSAGAMLAVYGASRLGVDELSAGIARAQGAEDRVLVSVFLDGGADALSVLSPVTNATYKSLRPNLALGEGEGVEFRDDPNWHWHPSAAALDALHRAGKVSLFPAIGYTDPDQSHFTSRHYWEVGALDPRGRTGWMGRLLDIIGSDDNPLQGLSLDGWLSPGLATSSKPVAAIDGTTYDLWAPGVWGDVEALMHDAIGAVGAGHAASQDSGRRRAGTVAAQSARLREQLATFGGLEVPASYPDHPFGQELAGLAAMLAVGLPIRCAAVNAAGGYDTHDSQESSFGDDLATTSQALAAFQADLEARGLADRVVTFVWSEFGRRPEENGSIGTDHGAAGTGLLIGTQVVDQVVGDFADLANLDGDDNLRHTSDFRAVYSSLVEQWFDVDGADVIPDSAQFTHPALIG
jgi:uncharacterized protein (DUF1501 family)